MSDFGPAQPIADLVGGAVSKVEHFLGYKDSAPSAPAPSAPDSSYHSQQLANANASFSHAAESTPQHEVHELHMPQSHGLVDQKYGKGNKAPTQTFGK